MGLSSDYAISEENLYRKGTYCENIGLNLTDKDDVIGYIVVNKSEIFVSEKVFNFLKFSPNNGYSKYEMGFYKQEGKYYISNSSNMKSINSTSKLKVNLTRNFKFNRGVFYYNWYEGVNVLKYLNLNSDELFSSTIIGVTLIEVSSDKKLRNPVIRNRITDVHISNNNVRLFNYKSFSKYVFRTAKKKSNDIDLYSEFKYSETFNDETDYLFFDVEDKVYAVNKDMEIFLVNWYINPGHVSITQTETTKDYLSSTDLENVYFLIQLKYNSTFFEIYRYITNNINTFFI